MTLNLKRYVVATFALFAFVFLYEGLVHGILLHKLYHESSKVWRSSLFEVPLSLSFQFVISAWVSFVFTQIYPDGGLSKGLRFGLYFGVFGALLSASWYVWLPISATLAWSWFIAGIVEGLGAGCVLGYLYRKSSGWKFF